MVLENMSCKKSRTLPPYQGRSEKPFMLVESGKTDIYGQWEKGENPDWVSHKPSGSTNLGLGQRGLVGRDLQKIQLS